MSYFARLVDWLIGHWFDNWLIDDKSIGMLALMWACGYSVRIWDLVFSRGLGTVLYQALNGQMFLLSVLFLK